MLSRHEAFKPGFSSSQYPPLGSVGCCVLAVYISSFLRLRLMCVWHYPQRKELVWQKSVKVLYLFCIDIPCWRIPTRNPNKVHLAANRNDDFFFFKQNSVFIEESWPQPIPHALMAPWQPSLQIRKSVERSPVSHQKRETRHCFYVHVVSRSTPSDMEGLGVFKSNSSLEKPRKPLQHYCVILLFPRLKELALSS